MNARKLRQAARRAIHYLQGDNYHEEAFECAEYILSTVRDDGDDPATYEKLCSIKKPYMENRKIWWNFDGFTVSVNSSGARFHCNHMPIASAQTMGQFRSLCRGLGIELKEVERVD